MQGKQLPSKYYLTHAFELFDFLKEHCTKLLSQQQVNYLNGLDSLSSDALCVLIRCLSRKPNFIKLSTLSYSEINDLYAALDELRDANYIRPAKHQDWPRLVSHLTKNQLVIALSYSAVKIHSSCRKAELLAHAQQCLNGSEPHIRPLLAKFVVKQQTDVIDYLFFLFFGDIKNRFQQFVMRDLGLMKTRKGTKNIARFSEFAEASSTFELQKRRRDFLLAPQALKEETANYLLDHKAIGHTAQRIRDQLLLSVANEFLPQDPKKSVMLFKASNDDGATEKWVRESYKHFDREKLKVELLKLRKTELPPTVKVFIEDFYARKYEGKRTSLFTDMLRETSTTIELDEAFINDVEFGVVSYHRQLGRIAYFAENKFWRILFALTFWDLLFGPDQTQFCEFDRLPNVLKNNTFYTAHKEQIKRCLAEFKTPNKLLKKLTQRSVAHYGKPNGIFNWSAGLLDVVRPALLCSNSSKLADVLESMAKNYSLTKDGYPDLIVIQQNKLRFEEVKAPGDTLRPNQLLAINRLREAKLGVDIAQVSWNSNPNQRYAVVDIETTGGTKGGHSITEIAVVHVQNRQIINEWSSLINPQRHIPAHITRLTGIDNALVAGAPVFAEIADQLDKQLDGAIFVAHNVGFDYGFIKAAYESLNRSFKKPKFCTVSQSRKTFPGLKSYSLSALTSHFDIDLQGHHRALNDARATAHLLRLIQDTRAANSKNL